MRIERTALKRAVRHRCTQGVEENMDYAVSFLICAIEIFLLWVYFRKMNIFNKESIEDEEGSASKVNSTQLYVSLGLIAFLMISATIITLGNVANYLNYLKLNLLLAIVAAASVVDLKKTIIPNLLILAGLGVRVAIYVAEFFLYNEVFAPQIKSDLIGLAFGFGFLLIVSLISRGALGFGDVKLFGIIGIMSGTICTYYTLVFCLIVSALVSTVLLITKKKGRKDSIPFGPCILIGYFVAIALSCY